MLFQTSTTNILSNNKIYIKNTNIKTTKSIINKINTNKINTNKINTNKINTNKINTNKIKTNTNADKDIIKKPLNLTFNNHVKHLVIKNHKKIGVVITTHGYNGIYVIQCIDCYLRYIPNAYIVLFVNESIYYKKYK